jgi:hypothetical protein
MKGLHPYYVTGLVEGEGSFYVGILPRKLGKVDFEVRPSFSLSQHKRNRSILFKLKEYFGCGTIRFSKRDQTYKFEVRSLKDLKEKILPHFEKFPLEGKKKKDFEIFKEVVERMERREHLEREGLLKIVELIQTITESEKRKKFLQKIATSLKE